MTVWVILTAVCSVLNESEISFEAMLWQWGGFISSYVFRVFQHWRSKNEGRLSCFWSNIVNIASSTRFTLYSHTNSYLLTTCGTVLLEKLTGSQLVKKFPAFYVTWMFITAFTSAHQLSLFWASSVESIPPHPTSWRSILILSSHLRLGLPSVSFPQVSPSKSCIRLSSPPYVLFFLILSPGNINK